MKKVLILAYDFPPYVSVGGLRPYSWYKYLHEFDVYPVVVTRQWQNNYGNQLDYIAPGESNEIMVEQTDIGTIIKTPYVPNLANRIMLKYGDTKYRLLRKIISAYYEFAQFIYYTGPKSNLYHGARQYLKNNKVDAIVATGDPFILFKYAQSLGREFNIPWMADYRDPWSQKASIKNNVLLNRWHTWNERRIVKTASAILTVNDYFKKIIAGQFNGKKIYVLPNGYDPDAFKALDQIKQQSRKLTIAYVGFIYPWHPIESFLKVISAFVSRKNQPLIRVNFYGINMPDELEQLIAQKFSNLKPHINIVPKIPNHELIKKLAEENLMLLFNYYSFPGTKIYDYLGLNRAILFCYSNDEEASALKKKYYPYEAENGEQKSIQEEIIHKTNSGYIVKDAAHLSSVLEELYQLFSSTGSIPCHTINAREYSRKHQVKIFAGLIKNR